ncbi:hypothetical protein [Streptomyces sp. BA2]|uniref:hypothetical protein n=1 Tax=Streptomyces sp. BA2 TaxID=436595 RepID=UPI001321C07B|nr:hypothetical protein [Streptomyces sp. BA2]MWA15986.1 hypothetical protein [Streptomyces sp. BA2]
MPAVRTALGAAAALLCGVALGTGPSPASASAADAQAGAGAGAGTGAGCGYPYVCFYIGETESGRFKDITSGWQLLGPSKGAEYAVNTRRDDGAKLHFTNGRTRCVAPGESKLLVPIGTVDKIRIMDSPQCRP